MANFKSSQDCKERILAKCGELVDGTSSLDARTLEYLNAVYLGLFSAGNEFDPDCDEVWNWAQATRPIVITLLPPYTTGTVTLTNDSRAGTFSSAPTLSQEGRYLRIESRSELFRIREHTASATSFTLDQVYTDESGTFNFKSIPLEYDLVNDFVVVDSTNDKIDFEESAGTELTATLTHGVYTLSTILTHVKTQMEVPGSETYTIGFDSLTRKFSVAHGGAFLTLRYHTATNYTRSFFKSVNFSEKNLTGATTYYSEVPFNSISRLAQPMFVARASNSTSSFQYQGVSRFNKDSVSDGNIYEVDRAVLQRDYPLHQLGFGTPTRYAKLTQKENGVITVQFNKCVQEETRVEVNWVPEPLLLQDNDVSTPKVPYQYRQQFLVPAAAYYVAMDKSDNKAQAHLQLAVQGLKALINHNRKDLSKAGTNYARLIPRKDC